MKIAIFHNLPIGGAKRVLFEQIKYLSRKHDVEIFTYTENTDKYFLLKNYAKINKFKSNINFNENRLIRDFNNFYTLDKVNRKIAKKINQSFDICLVHTDAYIEAPFLLKHLTIPSLYYDQELLAIIYSKDFKFNEDVNIFKYVYEILTRQVRKYIDLDNTKYASKIATNSEFMKKYIKKFYKKNAEVIYPGVDTKLFKKYKLSKNKFLFVGNKSKYEGWDFVKNIKSIKNLKKTGKKFDVASDDQMAKDYSSAIATICTNPVEAFGLKALESMACGTPVIAINEAAYPELVINNKTGFLVKRNKIKTATEKILSLKNREYKKLSENSIKHAKKFTWQNHNQKLEKMLLSLI